jgi:hypothetical protein
MNKIIYASFVACLLFCFSCNTSTVEHVSTGVQKISKCCSSIRKITTSGSGLCQKADNNKTEDFELKAVYAWDTKMLLW